jgi:hypothetical protein
MPSQIDLALKDALKGRPSYFIGKEEKRKRFWAAIKSPNLQSESSRIPNVTTFGHKLSNLAPQNYSKPSTLLTLPAGTNPDLAKLIFKLGTALKHKNKQRKR